MSNTKSPDSGASSDESDSGVGDHADADPIDADRSDTDLNDTDLDDTDLDDTDLNDTDLNGADEGGSSGAPDDDQRSSVPSSRRLRLVAMVAAVVLVLDQVTKIWAAAELQDRDIDLFWTARLHLIRNTGSAFGIGSQFGRWLALLVIGVVIALLLYARQVTDRRMLALQGAIVGGAIGNLIDRVLRADDGFLSGGVIDFIDFQWWPVFNVADMAVVCGAIGLMLLSMREPT